MFQLSKCYIYFLPLHAQEERHEEAEETATKNQQEYGTVYSTSTYVHFLFSSFAVWDLKTPRKRNTGSIRVQGFTVENK